MRSAADCHRMAARYDAEARNANLSSHERAVLQQVADAWRTVAHVTVAYQKIATMAWLVAAQV